MNGYGDLSSYRIPGIPDSIYYIANFLDSEEEGHILDSLPPSRWITLSHRRLQAYPSVLSKTNTLLHAPLPKWLGASIVRRFETLGVFATSPHKAPNHALVNEYRPNEGIMPHEDGAAYWPIVATVSLGAGIVLDIYDKRSEDFTATGNPGLRVPRWRIFQEPGSLLVTTDRAYTDLLHGIAEVDVDEDLTADTVANWSLLADPDALVNSGGKSVRQTRTSLTYRDVLKVSRIGSRLLGRSRG